MRHDLSSSQIDNSQTDNLMIGNFVHENLIPDRRLEDTLPSLDKEEREKALSFVKMMLAWLPEERKTARELIEHPFLQLK